VRFIDEHKSVFGVEPICRVLSEHGAPIAPSTCYAAVSRSPSARAVRDAQLRAEITRVWKDNREVYGADKVWLELNRQGIPVARCTTERLMRQLGLQGVRRGRKVRTTVPGAGGQRAPDLLRRDFTAPAPNRRWVADFTYVATWSGIVYVSVTWNQGPRVGAVSALGSGSVSASQRGRGSCGDGRERDGQVAGSCAARAGGRVVADLG
jgi:putative transposase